MHCLCVEVKTGGICRYCWFSEMSFDPRKIIEIPAAGLLAAVVLIGFAGCTQVPELGERVPDDFKQAPYPRLIPLEQALGPPPNPAKDAETLEETLINRRDALTRKARALQANPAIGPAQGTADE